jgi:hypothetical protein
MLRSLPVGRLQPLGTGYLITAYDDCCLIGSNEGIEIEQRIIEYLGEDKFFRKISTASRGGSVRH